MATKKLMRTFIAVAVLVGAVATRGASEEDDAWPQWRGPSRDGSSPGPDWPTSLEGLEVKWRVPLGKGYPGPVVTSDRVFVVETADAKTVAVRALDRATGSEVWKRNWSATGSVPFFARGNGDWVRSTPAFDGATLFVGGMNEVLVALDAATGDERWRVDFPARFGTEVPDFGFASSPLVDGDAVYVQAANSIVKLDRRSGKTLWRALDSGGSMQASGAFSSPVLAEIEGVPQLVVLSRVALSGLSTDTGDVLWSQEIPSFRGMHILTPVVVGNSVFTSPYKERSYLYTVRRTEGGFEVEETWTNPATGYMSTPVVIDGHAYMHLGNRRVDCIDLATGKSRWRSSESFGKYWSMTYQGDKILALDAKGSLLLMRADPEAFEILDSRQISDQETWAHLAIVGEEIFVRELEAITAYHWPRLVTLPRAEAGSRDAD